MDFTDILEQKWVVPAAVGVVGIAAGFGGGYILGKRHGFGAALDMVNESTDMLDESSDILEEAIEIVNALETVDPGLVDALREEIIEIENEDVYIEEEHEHIQYDTTVDQILTEGDLDLAQAVIDAGGELNVLPGTPDVPITVQRANVFSNPDDVWDEDEEQAKRVEGQPYVITKDQFFNSDTGYNQHTLTYYAGDDILVNELEAVIYNPKEIVGAYVFGHGSGAATVFYARNETLEKEFEVVKELGKYEIEVLGHTIEQDYEDGDLRHSSTPTRFRED